MTHQGLILASFYLLSAFVVCDVIIGNNLADDAVADDAAIEIKDRESFIKSSKDHEFLLVLFNRKDQKCSLCEAVLSVLRDICERKGIALRTSGSKHLSDSFSVSLVPSLVYIRNGEPILYDGDLSNADISDEIETWLEVTAQPCIQTLTDETFEHLTQASTGATTGDWLISFFSPECDQLLAVVDAVCFSIRHLMNVARVNLTENIETKQRFSPKTCSQLIFFRHGKMYRYDRPDHRPSSLVAFVTSGYTHTKSQPVPTPQSPFDKLLESIVNSLKIQMHGPNRPIIIGASIAILVVMVTVAVVSCKSAFRHQEHEHKD